MAIIYPQQCRGITAGALREIKQKGYTTAAGGWFWEEFANGRLTLDPTVYFRKTEHAGVFMEALENTKTQINENTEAIQEAGRKLVESAKEANKQMADVTGKFRHGTESLGAAIDKLMKVAGRGDFKKTVELTESLVTSLERLAALEEKGLLDKVMRAMRP